MKLTIKKISYAVLFTAISVLTVNAQNATKWEIDKNHTSVNFSINHFFSTVTGKFTKFDGSVNFDQANLSENKVTFTIPVSGVNTQNTKRDDHLQSGDFFDVEKYPVMTFTSTRFEKKSDADYLVYGKLTIRNTTKDVVLPLKIKGEMEHPMMQGTIILGLSLNTTINRTDYGVGTGSWAATMVVGDEVDIEIHMELNKML